MINFNDITESHIAIHLNSNEEIHKLVDILDSYGYEYGTNGNSLQELKHYRMAYCDWNAWFSLDRSKQYYDKNFVSFGKGYRDTLYEFNGIEFPIVKVKRMDLIRDFNKNNMAYLFSEISSHPNDFPTSQSEWLDWMNEYIDKSNNVQEIIKSSIIDSKENESFDIER